MPSAAETAFRGSLKKCDATGYWPRCVCALAISYSRRSSHAMRPTSLRLRRGDEATAIIKATEVMVRAGTQPQGSFRLVSLSRGPRQEPDANPGERWCHGAAKVGGKIDWIWRAQLPFCRVRMYRAGPVR